MSKFTIIRDSASLNKGLTNFQRTAAAFRNAAHVLAVSCLVHANEHGQVAPLNRFAEMLLPNELTALKNYVRRFQDTRNENGDIVHTQYFFLKYDDGEFRIDTTSPAANRGKNSPFQKYAESTLINPDGKTSKPFLYQDNVRDISILGDDKVISALRKMYRAASGKKKGVKSDVSPKYVDLLAKAVEQAEMIASANPN